MAADAPNAGVANGAVGRVILPRLGVAARVTGLPVATVVGVPEDAGDEAAPATRAVAPRQVGGVVGVEGVGAPEVRAVAGRPSAPGLPTGVVTAVVPFAAVGLGALPPPNAGVARAYGDAREVDAPGPHSPETGAANATGRVRPGVVVPDRALAGRPAVGRRLPPEDVVAGAVVVPARVGEPTLEKDGEVGGPRPTQVGVGVPGADTPRAVPARPAPSAGGPARPPTAGRPFLGAARADAPGLDPATRRPEVVKTAVRAAAETGTRPAVDGRARPRPRL